MIGLADIDVIERMLGTAVSDRVIAATDQLVGFLEGDDDVASLTDRDMAQLVVIGAYLLAAVALTMAPPVARDGLPAQLGDQLRAMTQMLARRSVEWDGGGSA